MASYTLHDYLYALKMGDLDASRPFDSKADVSVTLEESARNLQIAIHERINLILPPETQLIHQIQMALKPVLNEVKEAITIVDSVINKGDVNHPELNNRIMKGYLFNAILAMTKKSGQITSSDAVGIQTFLRHVSDSLVDEVTPSHFLNYVAQRKGVKAQFDTMVQTMSLDFPTRDSLIKKYLSEKRSGMAYQASIFPSEEFEVQLITGLKKLLLNAVGDSQIVLSQPDKNQHKTLGLFSRKKTTRLESPLEQTLKMFANAAKSIPKEQLPHYFKTLKSSPFFSGQMTESDNHKQAVKVLSKKIDKVRQSIATSTHARTTSNTHPII